MPYDDLVEPKGITDIPRLITAYYEQEPQGRVSFGTSGHRGSSLRGTFNEAHILAICQSLCELREADGPLFLGIDTHALSEPAFVTALEVFAANGVRVEIQEGRGYTPTPVLSHAVLTYNAGRTSGLSDAVVITPSHNPPEDGGFKYNPPTGGPADSRTTASIQQRANLLLDQGLKGVRRMSYRKALAAETTRIADFLHPYVVDLASVVDMDLIARAGLKIGVDPMGGAGVGFWEPIAYRYGLNLEVVNTKVDHTFGFMPLDHDGKIRMDCSSPHAMAGLVDLRHRFDIAFGNDPDADRHGIVTPEAGLLNPNHYLSVAASYLYQNRPQWPEGAAVAKTVVTSSMINRVAESLGRSLIETPVGFKWFVGGLASGSFGLAGEESAGASFLRKDGEVWTTDKDGIIMALLAAEITAKTQRDPGEFYAELESRFGSPVFQRVDTPAALEEKAALLMLSPEMVQADTLAGEHIEQILTRAPGNNAPIGGLKVVTKNGWFAARPSGTENIYKVYAESFLGRGHLAALHEEARAIVSAALRKAGL